MADDPYLEQEMDQWMAKRRQKIQSKDRLVLSSSLESDQSLKPKPKIKTFQQILEEKAERERRVAENGVSASNESVENLLRESPSHTVEKPPFQRLFPENAEEPAQITNDRRSEQSKKSDDSVVERRTIDHNSCNREFDHETKCNDGSHLSDKRYKPKVAPKPKKSSHSPSRAKTFDETDSMLEVAANGVSNTSNYQGVTFFYFLPSDESLTTAAPSGETEGVSTSTLNVTVTQGRHAHIASWTHSDLSQEGFGFGITGGGGTPVLVKNVVSDVSANLCNLNEEDEILSVNGQKVTVMSHEQVVGVMSEAIKSGSICLKVNRMGMEVTCQTAEEVSKPAQSQGDRKISNGVTNGFLNSQLEPKSKSFEEKRRVYSGPTTTLSKRELEPSPDEPAVAAPIVVAQKEDLISFDSPQHLKELQSIPVTGSASLLDKEKDFQISGKVKSSRNFFEQMMEKEREDAKERSERLKNLRKSREVEERMSEAQRGRKYVDKEPVKYTFALDDELFDQPTGLDKPNSKEISAGNRKVFTSKEENGDKLDVNGREKILIHEELDENMTLEMEEFEEEFASQQVKIMQQLCKQDGNDNNEEDEMSVDVNIGGRGLEVSIGGFSNRDPIEGALGSQRAPSRASGVIQPESYTPQSSVLNTSQESLNLADNRIFAEPSGNNFRDDKKGSKYGTVEENGWKPQFSGPLASERQTLVFDPTGHRLDKSSQNSHPVLSHGTANLKTSTAEISDPLEEFEMAKKALDKKFREQKRNLLTSESSRIEMDQNDHENLKRELNKMGKIDKLNNAKRKFSARQKDKDEEFERLMNQLKKQYKNELNQLCVKYNVGSPEAFMESDLKLAVEEVKHSKVQTEDLLQKENLKPASSENTIGNLSPTKYSLVKQWAEESSQSMEMNKLYHSQDDVDFADGINATESGKQTFAQLNVDSNTSSRTSKSRRRLISANSNSDRHPESGRETDRSTLEESRSSYYIKKRPISGITRMDVNQLQSYYTSTNPAVSNQIRYPYKSKDVDSFNEWLDSLHGLGSMSLPKVPMPQADNYVERIELPDDDAGNQGSDSNPLPSDLINALLQRLDPKSTSSNRSSDNRTPKVHRSRQGRHTDERTNGLKKWKSAPLDLNEEGAQNGSHNYDMSSQEHVWTASEFNLQSSAPESLPFGRPTREVPPLSKNNKRAYKELPPVPPQKPAKPPQKQRGSGNDLYGNYPFHDVTESSTEAFFFDLPPRVPPRDQKPQQFHEMSVDDPGKRPKMWLPLTESPGQTLDPKSTIPWNARGRDHKNMQPVANHTLTRRFEFRDAQDPYGFKSLSRQPDRNQTLPGSDRPDTSGVTPSSTLNGAYKVKPRIEGLSEVHHREMTKPQGRHKNPKKWEPCSKCGLPLGIDGTGLAVQLEGLNSKFHPECFHCSNCLKRLDVPDVGRNVKVNNSRVHCEQCSSNERGYQYTQC